jgi:hypothetical protein
MKCKEKTIKAFENLLFDKCGQLGRASHTENGYDEPDKKLYLYYANGKHVGTFNRTDKKSFVF